MSRDLHHRRSFTTKLTRQSNSEVRRHVLAATTATNGGTEVPSSSAHHHPSSSSRPTSSLSYFSEVLLTDVVEPVNFEEYVDDHSDIISRDPFPLLVDVPKDDIDVRLIPRRLRTVGPILPDFRDFVDQEDPYINDCLKTYTSGWVVVVKKYENRLSNSERRRHRILLAKSLPRQEFEVDLQDGQSSDSNRPQSSPVLSTCSQSSTSEASSAYVDAQSHCSDGANECPPVDATDPEKTPDASFLSPSTSMNDSVVTLKNLSLNSSITASKTDQNVIPSQISPRILTSSNNRSIINGTLNTTNGSSRNHDHPVERPPLASDEETSGEDSPTRERKRRSHSLSSSAKIVLRHGNRQNQTLDDMSVASRLSWQYIDSPSHTLDNCNRSRVGNSGHRLSVTSRESRSSRFFDLTNAQHDPILSSVLESKGQSCEDTEDRKVLSDGKARHPHLLALYPLEEDESMIEIRPPARAPREHLGHRLLVKCTSLKFDVDVEPIFLSLALYDAREKKKVSENFYFDMNSEDMKNLLSPHIPFQDMSTMCRQCILNVTFPSSDLFLVFRLEKVLQGDPADSIDPYVTRDDRSREKLRNNAAVYCDKLGKYRQPFAWTAVCLMDVLTGVCQPSTGDRNSGVLGSFGGSSDTLDSQEGGFNSTLDRRSSGSSSYDTMKRLGDTLTRMGSLERKDSRNERRRSLTQEELAAALDNFHPVTITMNSVFRQDYDRLKDEDLYKCLQDFKTQGGSYKRLKHIKCDFKIELTPCRESPPYTLTPELAKISPYPDDRPKVRLTKELVEFPVREVLTPHYHYRNLLYVYPKTINFTNRPGAGGRNITCKVQLMSGEDDYSVLNSIFGKSGSPEFTTEAFTSVVYHNKTPDWGDEVKIKLPTKLLDQHHILFTFYHISCQVTKKNPSEDKNLSTETPIGWTWLPLYRDGRLQTGNFNLPVMMEKPPTSYSFLTPFIQIPNTKWVDGHKEVFTVQVEAVTSIHTQDSHLDAFLSLLTSIEERAIPIKYQNNIESEFKKSIIGLAGAQIEPLVKFFPLIMNKLVRLLVRPPLIGNHQVLSVGQDVFESMARIVSKVSKLSEPTRSSLLVTFTHYQCLFPHPDPFPDQQNSLSPTRSNSIPNMASLSSSTNGQTCQPDISSSSGFLSRIGSVRVPATNYHTTHHSHHRPSSSSGSQTSHSWRAREASSTEDVFSSTTTNGQSRTMGPHIPRKLFHEELLLQWVVSSGVARELSFANSSFFFDLIVKSASENLAITGALQLPRKDRFSIQFTDDLTTLVNGIVTELVIKLTRDTKDMEVIQKLNIGLAFFIRDLLSLADRSFIFSLIRSYCRNIHLNGTHLTESVVNQLFCLKTDFLRIICSHEHYFALNLPFNSPLFPQLSPLARSNSFGHISSFFSLYDRVASFSEMSEDYRRQHFLSGLVLSTLVSSLETSSAVVQSKAVSLLKNIIGHHDWDPSCQQHPGVREKFASLYLPLLSIVMDSLGQLHDFSPPSSENGMTRNGTIKRTELKRRPVARRNSSCESDGESSQPAVDPSIANAIAGRGGLPNFPSNDNQLRRYPLREDTTRDLLLCFLWVIKNIPRDLLSQWLREIPSHRLTLLTDVLHVCSSCFTYRGKKTVKNMGTSTLRKNSDLKLKLEDAIMGLGSARRELIMRRRDRNSTGSNSTSQSFSVGDHQSNVRWRKEAMANLRYTNMRGKTKEEIETELCLGGHVATEVSRVILDTCDSMVTVVGQQGDTNSDDLRQYQILLASILQLVINGLSLNQSTTSLTTIFSFQRLLLSKYPSLVFEERFERELCSELCLQLLKHCSSSISSIRSQASASLYLLMRQNFHQPVNFAKVKMQVTMSLSSLVGSSHTQLSEQYLRRSLKTLLVYAVMDQTMKDSSFPDQVQELVFNLHMILSDTIRMKEYQEDPEMLMDLMYRIAKGYQNSPDLRLTWLLNMAQKHLDRGNHTEAGHCYIHCAAMVSEYLHHQGVVGGEGRTGRKSYLPISCSSYQSISANILEEETSSAIMSSSQSSNGLCSAKTFSEAGLINLLERAAVSFTSASLYETVNEAYKLLMPIAEGRRDYHKLSSIHGRLQEICMKIHLFSTSGKNRVFETYFRIGFYGLKFGDLHGEEFVYKEPHLTKLAEISHRLENFYVAQFGPEYVEVIKDSNPVDERKLDPEKVYIQITYVEPFFEEWELENRPSAFDRNYNIRRFIFSTPFTLDGRAHGSLHEQHKRKTILTTEKSFPYVKTRINVIDRQVITLTPIEVAIDDILKKTNELAAVIYQPNCDPKILQMLLQGCVGCTVNQGPLEVANVFLSDSSKAVPQRPPTLLQSKLRECFKDFCRKVGDALRRNRSLIGPDQKEYQKEMERNYLKFTERLAPMISPRGGRHVLQSLRDSSTSRTTITPKTSPLI